MTLDDQERPLIPDMLVIADTERAVALAGVMGGANTEINDNTVNILFESAVFDPVSVRRTAKALGMRTEASMRFERGVSPQTTYLALKAHRPDDPAVGRGPGAKRHTGRV